MYFHHLHFYVKDTAVWKEWFVCKLGFQPAAVHALAVPTGPLKLVQSGIEIWLSGPEHASDVVRYLQHHPPGLVDIALATPRFESVLTQAQKKGVTLLAPVSANTNGQRSCQLQGWDHLRHTLIEVSDEWIESHQPPASADIPLAGDAFTPKPTWLSWIDHVVINVPQGQMQAAVAWYQKIFGLQLGQSFEINTAHSGLCSQVLIHPEGTLQIPINEPTSDSSQVQEFLHYNRGAGVQHVALRSQNAVDAIAHFRNQGLQLLNVPPTYYEDLHQRPDCPLRDLAAVSRQELLVDWPQGGNQGMLLQTFTEPIFAEPTFFFEIIERSYYREEGQMKTARGFGEGNFQALFEAIERAQMRRDSLGR